MHELCNAPVIFQRCMIAIFADMLEEIMEVFMDDFSLCNLSLMLQHCEENDLVVNREKRRFMAQEIIVLGHYAFVKGLKVDRAKIDTITKPPPTNVKESQSFLVHCSFYMRSIKDFSKIAKPLCNLLEKNTPFVLD